MFNPTTNIKNPVLAWLYVLTLVAVGFGLPFYWMATTSGLFEVLARLQGRAFGSYAPKLTFLACVLVNLGCALAVVKAVTYVRRRSAVAS